MFPNQPNDAGSSPKSVRLRDSPSRRSSAIAQRKRLRYVALYYSII
jgi:hypothetical protein